MTNDNASTDIARVWHKLDPSHYYEAGEIAILRAYFGLKPRRGDPALADLYEAPVAGHETADRDESDEGGGRDYGWEKPRTGPIRLRHLDVAEPVTELNEAVARICLSEVQDRLPQWSCSSPVNGFVLGRARFTSPERTFTPLNPQRLLCINWADSGPGFSWPEDYYVTLLPGFGRYVLTASADSPDAYGVTDFALGWFRDSEDRLEGSKRLLLRWWRWNLGYDTGPWEYLFHTGLIDRAEAYRLRRRAWGDRDE